MFVSVAHAMGAQGQAGGDPLMGFMPIILMLAIFYFLLIRPQQKRTKEHKAMLAALKKGDTVITSAGFIGRIVDLDDEMLTIDLGETKVQVGRGYVAGLSNARMPKQGKKDGAKKDADKKDAVKESEPVAESAAEQDVEAVEPADGDEQTAQNKPE